MTKNPSPKLIRALLILRDKRPRNSAAFAKMMWPDSVMHRMVSNQGRGATRGKAAWLCGGSYLGRLKKDGWVMVNKTWERRSHEPIAYLTLAADDLLSQHASNNPMQATGLRSSGVDEQSLSSDSTGDAGSNNPPRA